jgi:hypothetical protein
VIEDAEQLALALDGGAARDRPRHEREKFKRLFAMHWREPPTLDGENWRRCETWPRWWASNLGRVALSPRGWTRPPSLLAIGADSREGRPRVAGRFRSHDFVANAWLGEKPRGLQVRHLDGDASNNRPENLAYGTPKENMDDAVRHGTRRRALDHETALELLTNHAETDYHMARRLGLNYGTVQTVREGRSYQWVAPLLPRRVRVTAPLHDLEKPARAILRWLAKPTTRRKPR